MKAVISLIVSLLAVGLLAGCGTPKGQAVHSTRQTQQVIEEQPLVVPDQEMQKK